MRIPMVLLVSALLASCAGTHLVQPDGFASYGSPCFASDHKAVSPEGVTWHIHVEKKQPAADLSFWKIALRKRMAEAGYRITDSLDFQSAGQLGYALELTAPLGGADYYYLVAAVPNQGRILVAEASGAAEAYLKRRPAILAALLHVAE